jgi:hypothetical protein
MEHEEIVGTEEVFRVLNGQHPVQREHFLLE